ncbi:MAG: aminotransferase class V-fold PLP-dependent enzyme [Oceanospirillales bacterium TMED33]|nr:cysteine desulfurase [Gammaproteobacteria bacterium]OUX65091.1 MAG: cysteine desulfurase [Gammaproteobacteria bacterium TMED281]RPG20687.1 MAG: aminotransferase class V-fold PLP-dependent enzyme [Oceanospirillales bacterium TMED33]
MMTAYFDNASTTPVDPRVIDKMRACLGADGTFGNPASTTHGLGWMASEEVEWARSTVAKTIGADPREIVWTSGATESDNLAIRGVLEAMSEATGRNKIITMETEHKAVLDTCAHLRGAEVIYLKPKADGQLCLDSLASLIDETVLLVSVMLVNNETGVVQPIAKIAKMAHDIGALLHSDLAQSVGKLDWTVDSLGIDLGSLSAHKAHGPKGIGALYVRRGSCRVAEQQHGGHHERGMRSGTLPTHQIVGMAEAYRIAQTESAAEIDYLNRLRDRIESAIDELGGIRCNGARGVPHILNITVDGIDAERLMAAMPTIAVSTGSACNSATIEPSHVLQAMGLTRKQGLSSLRISLGRMTTDDEVSMLIHSLTKTVSQLRSAA